MSNIVIPNEESDKKITETCDLFEQFENIIASLSACKIHINGVQQQIKTLEKSVTKQMKSLNKSVTKSKNKGNRQPSGFAKPTKVTKELCYFMNKTEGTEIARTEVTRALVAYIKGNNLENKTNSKIIAPDEKLKLLLDIDEKQELTYFNIQKYMNKHFISSKTIEVKV